MNILGKVTRLIGSRILTAALRPAVLSVQQATSQPCVSSRLTSISHQTHSKGVSTYRQGGLVQCNLSQNINSNKAQTTRLTNLLSVNNANLQFMRSYKVKTVLTLRCSGCYYVRRHGRLFVECKDKPRHKQMAKINKKDLMVDDTSKGNVSRACWWKFQKHRWYKKGCTPYVKNGYFHQGLGTEF